MSKSVAQAEAELRKLRDLIGSALAAVERAGVSFSQLRSNGKVQLDEDGARWTQDVYDALADAGSDLAQAADGEVP